MTNIDISNPAYEHYRYNKARNFILLNVGEWCKQTNPARTQIEINIPSVDLISLIELRRETNLDRRRV